MASFFIQTFGCQMNVRDSSWLATALTRRGLIQASCADADVVILNTCSVREKPERKVTDAIVRLWRESRHPRLVAVLGCVGQQLGEKLFLASPQVRLVGGGDCMAQVPDAITALLQNPVEKLSLLEISPDYKERELLNEQSPTRSAFVNIMQGCDNFCSYCIVPFTRGRQKSRSREAILEECATWLQNGAIELTLLGQNVNVWGNDKKDRGRAFAELLRSIAKLPGLCRLRFVTPHPADMGADVIACFNDLKVLCPRLHLPLQAGADKTLIAMRRRHTQAEYLRLVDNLRKARPDIALSTDLIVGFPGESEEDFQETLEMIVKCGFMASYSFCYSDRPGTRASMMSNKIDEDIKLERLSRLQALQDAQTAQWLAARIGNRTEILLENKSPRGSETSWQGRDVYGACVNVELTVNGDHGGELCQTLITGAKKHSLTGECLHPKPFGGFSDKQLHGALPLFCK